MTLAEIYGTLAVLILKPTSTRLVEVIIYLLNGPGLAPQKSHILQLGYSGRFAMNIVDDLIVVHHQVYQQSFFIVDIEYLSVSTAFQASATSLLFDIALSGASNVNDIAYHTPVTLGRPIKPFSLKVPSLSLDGQTKNCELCMCQFLTQSIDFDSMTFLTVFANNFRFTKLGSFSTKYRDRCKAGMPLVC